MIDLVLFPKLENIAVAIIGTTTTTKELQHEVKMPILSVNVWVKEEDKILKDVKEEIVKACSEVLLHLKIVLFQKDGSKLQGSNPKFMRGYPHSMIVIDSNPSNIFFNSHCPFRCSSKISSSNLKSIECYTL